MPLTKNKKNPENLLERIVRGEISTAEEIRNIRKNNSAPAEIFRNDIEEAVIVEKRVLTQSKICIKSIKTRLDEIELILLEKDGLLESDSKILEEILEMLNKIEAEPTSNKVIVLPTTPEILLALTEVTAI